MSKRIKSMLQDSVTNTPIQTSGGAVYVAVAGGTAKVALIDKDGATIANPVPIVNGEIEFNFADSINSVDLYGLAPGGQPFEAPGVKPGGPPEIYIDTIQRGQTLRLPFNIADTTAAVETDTGFDLPAKAVVLFRDMGLDIEAIDATETIDVGTLSSEGGGDANGLIAAGSVAVLGLVLSTALSAGFLTDAAAAKSISYTLTAGSDTASGFIRLSWVLAA